MFYLPLTLFFYMQMIPKEAAKLYLEKGYIPYLNEETVYNIDDNINYTFLVHGRVKVMNRPDLELVGPTYVPSSIRVLEFNVCSAITSLSTQGLHTVCVCTKMFIFAE